MPEIVSSLQSKFDKAETKEVCGLVLLDGTLIDVPNVHDEPEHGFRIPAKLMLQYEAELYGTWHTHPQDTANLSLTDYAGFSQWPRLRHFIIGVDGVRCFTLKDELIVEVAL